VTARLPARRGDLWTPPNHKLWINQAAAQRLGLTDRMCEVLCGIANGLTNEAIAWRLFLPVETVKSRVKRLLGVLGASDRAHAVAIAYDRRVLRTAGERARLAHRVAS